MEMLLVGLRERTNERLRSHISASDVELLVLDVRSSGNFCCTPSVWDMISPFYIIPPNKIEIEQHQKKRQGPVFVAESPAEENTRVDRPERVAMPWPIYNACFSRHRCQAKTTRATIDVELFWLRSVHELTALFPYNNPDRRDFILFFFAKLVFFKYRGPTNGMVHRVFTLFFSSTKRKKKNGLGNNRAAEIKSLGKSGVTLYRSMSRTCSS